MKTKLSVLISMFAAASVFAAGDIYEIRPCTENGVNTSPYATYENPLGSGTSNIYFNVRLKLRGDGNNPNRDDLRRKYTLECWDPTATYQEIYDAVNVFLRERLVEYDLVKTVEKFGTEAALEQLGYGLSCFLADLTVLCDTLQNGA